MRERSPRRKSSLVRLSLSEISRGLFSLVFAGGGGGGEGAGGEGAK